MSEGKKFFTAAINAVNFNEDVVQYLITLLEDYGKTLDYIRWAIVQEIDKNGKNFQNCLIHLF